MVEFVYNLAFEQRDKLLGISSEWTAKRGSGSVRKFDFY